MELGCISNSQTLANSAAIATPFSGTHWEQGLRWGVRWSSLALILPCSQEWSWIYDPPARPRPHLPGAGITACITTLAIFWNSLTNWSSCQGCAIHWFISIKLNLKNSITWRIYYSIWEECSVHTGLCCNETTLLTHHPDSHLWQGIGYFLQIIYLTSMHTLSWIFGSLKMLLILGLCCSCKVLWKY